VDRPQLFWDAFRKRFRANIPSLKADELADWTALRTRSGVEACAIYARGIGREVVIGTEGHYQLPTGRRARMDVYARDRSTGELVVAFESELAWWGYNGTSGKDWSEEFPKLCGIRADLRVLTSTFKVGTGAGFPAFLREKLDSMRGAFDRREPGEFCLAFGPEYSKKDPRQDWLAFAVEDDYSLRSLTSAKPLITHLIWDGKEPPTE
jgi:hypothetical protein